MVVAFSGFSGCWEIGCEEDGEGGGEEGERKRREGRRRREEEEGGKNEREKALLYKILMLAQKYISV